MTDTQTSTEVVVATPSPFTMVQEFSRIYEFASLAKAGFPAGSVEELRVSLLIEEVVEYILAVIRGDLVEIADALADIQYIINGSADAYGFDLDKVFAEVHRSNLSKLGEDGRPIRRADGKALKGPNYTRPDLVNNVGIPAIFRGHELKSVEGILTQHGLTLVVPESAEGN